MSSAPSFLAWIPAVAAASTAAVANYAFANNGGAGDTISDTLGTAAALTALDAAFDTHTVAVGDRLLLTSQAGAASFQNGVYQATKVATVFGQVSTITLAAGGTGYTNGIYRGIATTSGGSGTGALVDVTVSGGVVVSIAVSQVYGDSPGTGGPAAGSGYAVGDTVVPVGIGSGTGFSATVATLCPAFVLTRASDANSSEQFVGMSVFVAGGATLAGHAFVQTVAPFTLDLTSVISGTSTIVQPTATSFFPIVNGTYTNVPLTGGHGTGAGATIVVASGSVSSVTITSVGSGYQNNDVLSFSGYGGSSYEGAGPGMYGLGSGGTVEVTTSAPASSTPVFTTLVS